MKGDMNQLRGQFNHHFRDFILDVSFEIPAQGFTAVFGRSASGKSALLRCIAGLDRARGFLHLAADCWQDDASGVFVPTHLRKIGLVTQSPFLFSHLNVRGNLEFGYHNVPVAERRIRFDEVLHFLGLEALLGRRVGKLSGGERQRVAIARALLTSPRLLLLDEPLSALDSMSKKEILPYFEKLRSQFQLPVLYVSHDLAEIEQIAETILVMEGGRIRAETIARYTSASGRACSAVSAE